MDVRALMAPVRVLMALTIGALILSGCSGKAASSSAPSPAPAEQAAPAAAEQPASSVKEGQAASQAVDQINGQTGATVDGIK